MIVPLLNTKQARRLAILLALPVLLFAFPAVSQTVQDTLQEVQVQDKRKKALSTDDRLNIFSPGQTVHTIDSIVLQRYQTQSVAQVLARQTPVFIKSYGFNGLATLNFRGSSAAQSQVYWNGVPVNNAALGIADVSLLPVAMINKLHVVYGSSASLFGSGNVGGALWMESDQPSFDTSRHYELFASGGSYSQGTVGGKLKLNSHCFSFSGSVLAQSAQNDFPYKDISGNRQEMQNSALRGISSLAQLAYQTNRKDVIRLAGWYQYYYREIPPAMFESGSVKQREDGSLKLLLDWDRKRTRNHWYARTAYISDDMGYEDSAINLSTSNRSSQWYTEAGWKKTLGTRHQLIFFAPVQFSWMDSAGKPKDQLKYALAAAYSFSGVEGKLLLSASTRAETVDGFGYLLPGVNGAYRLLPSLKLRANVQRTYRVPSLNELYFSPGGNPKLKPEYGWSQEVGYRLERRLSYRVNLLHDVDVYNRKINDWIYWLGGAIWTPHNIANVRSRGVETENVLTVELDDWKWHLGVNAAYARSTTLASHIPGDGSVGKQIPYTPKLTGVGSLGIENRSFMINYDYSYTGERYVNVDESLRLKDYSVSNIYIGYYLPVKKDQAFRLSLQVCNLFDVSYQVVNARPMAGRNWLVGISWSKTK